MVSRGTVVLLVRDGRDGGTGLADLAAAGPIILPTTHKH